MRNRSRLHVAILYVFSCCADIRDQSRKCKIDPNFTDGNFLGEGPEFWTCIIKFSHIYTVGHRETCHFIWDHNSHVSWWIFTLLARMETGKILYRGIKKFATLPLCLYTTQEILKTHTTAAHFETNCHCILMLNAINGKNESK